MTGHKPWSEIKHKASPAAVAEVARRIDRGEIRSQVEYTAAPWADVPGLDHAPDDALSAFAASMTGNPRALGAACSIYHPDRMQATFQVEAETIAEAASLALSIFEDALASTGLPSRASGIALCEGGPDGLDP